jgi:tRNA(Ile)-lysidine synthase
MPGGVFAGPGRDAAFAARMAALGPFEPAPHIAVAVSGGADSLALCLLAEAWARGRGGRVTAFTVDHGLVPGSADVCRGVTDSLAARGIETRILSNDRPAPETGLEAHARAVRYALLRSACHAAGILHLLVAHTRDDQAETLLLRLGAGSGDDGLAAMSPVTEWPEVRVLRPLLNVARADVRAVCAAEGLTPWDDPMNADPRFRRVRVRAALQTLAHAGLSADRLAEAARDFARARAALEAEAAKLAARAVALHPQGYAVADAGLLDAAEPEVRARLLARLVGAVGGRVFAPSPSRAEALIARLAAGKRRASLAGCVVEAAGATLTVFRECRGKAAWRTIPAGATVLWDGRFPVTAPQTGDIRVIRADGRADVRAARDAKVPVRAARALPWAEDRSGREAAGAVGPFRPRLSLCGPGAYVHS